MIRQIYHLYKWLFAVAYSIASIVVMRLHKVHYKNNPRIMNGVIQISNRGSIDLGEGVGFINGTQGNFVGINKSCSLCTCPGASIRIGDYSGFSGCSIYCAGSITIGNHCNFGGNVSIWDTDFHPLNYLDRRQHKIGAIKVAPILIDDDVFVGANSMILKGVHIGARSIIGAGSVVTHSIPSDEIWAGAPARFIRKA